MLLRPVGRDLNSRRAVKGDEVSASPASAAASGGGGGGGSRGKKGEKFRALKAKEAAKKAARQAVPAAASAAPVDRAGAQEAQAHERKSDVAVAEKLMVGPYLCGWL